MAFRELVVEAIKKSTIMANSIVRRMNVAEWKNIARMTEMDADYISDLASFHMPSFDDLSDDEKQEVVEKVWNKLKAGEKPDEVMEANPEETPLSQSELKQKIIDYVKQNGAVLYPLEQAAEELAQTLSTAEKTEDKQEKCPCCGKSPCECDPDCDCKCKKEDIDKKVIIHTTNGKVDYIEQGCYMPNGIFISDAGVNFDKGFVGMDPEEAKQSLIKFSRYPAEKIIIESVIKEAVMNDIPHEIDDQIHTLKDMRFELEQTKKNWNIAGVETQPMDQILKDIDGLIASLYHNGAVMADDELTKETSNEKPEEQEIEKEEE